MTNIVAHTLLSTMKNNLFAVWNQKYNSKSHKNGIALYMYVIRGVGALGDKGLLSLLLSNALLVLSDYRPHPIPYTLENRRSSQHSQVNHVGTTRNRTPTSTIQNILD